MAHFKQVSSVAVHGDRVISCSTELGGSVVVWDRRDLKLTCKLELAPPDTCVCMSAHLDYAIRSRDDGLPVITDFS